MRPLVNGQMLCSTQNNANQVKTYIENRINTMQNFSLTEPVTAFPHKNGNFMVNFSVLADTVADADALFDYIVANWTSGPQSGRILTGSRIRRTNNYDDEVDPRADEVIREAVK